MPYFALLKKQCVSKSCFLLTLNLYNHPIHRSKTLHTNTSYYRPKEPQISSLLVYYFVKQIIICNFASDFGESISKILSPMPQNIGRILTYYTERNDADKKQKEIRQQ